MNSNSQYEAYRTLRHKFYLQMGRARAGEIPEDLIRGLAEFCDAYPNDSMTGYYAGRLILHFYKRRSKDGWVRLQSSLAELLKHKRFLVGIFAGYAFSAENPLPFAGVRVETVWSAIADRPDGYDLANLFGKFRHLFNHDTLQLAFQRANAMPDTFRVRALANLFPRMEDELKFAIRCFLLDELARGSSEAAHQLKLHFQHFDKRAQSDVVSAFLNLPKTHESSVAYLIIRNAKLLCKDDALRLADRVRGFDSDYLRNRSLLKLIRVVPVSEISDLYEQFIDRFMNSPPTVESIHNLYQFSAVLDLDKNHVVEIALEKISQLEDPYGEIWNQSKYGQLLFIAPHLSESHRHRAMEIAKTVRGGYGRAVIKKLERQFANGAQFCSYRHPAICY